MIPKEDWPPKYWDKSVFLSINGIFSRCKLQGSVLNNWLFLSFQTYKKHWECHFLDTYWCFHCGTPMRKHSYRENEPFQHLFSLNWWVDNNLTLQVQHLLCSLPKSSEQKVFKGIVKSLNMWSNKISTPRSKPLAGRACFFMIQEIENSLLHRGCEWGLCYQLDSLEQ